MDGPGIYKWSYSFNTDCVVSGLYNWQTFLGAILALLAAAGTAALVWLQIGKQTDQIDLMKQQLENQRARVQQERAGKLRAARGSLPGTLNEVCEYATELATAFHKGRHFRVSLYSTTRIDPEELFRQAQLVEARARPFGSGKPIKPIKRIERLDLNLDAATLYAIAVSLFPFSRGEADNAPPHGGAFQAIQQMGILNQEAIDLAAKRMVAE